MGVLALQGRPRWAPGSLGSGEGGFWGVWGGGGGVCLAPVAPRGSAVPPAAPGAAGPPRKNTPGPATPIGSWPPPVAVPGPSRLHRRVGSRGGATAFVSHVPHSTAPVSAVPHAATPVTGRGSMLQAAGTHHAAALP